MNHLALERGFLAGLLVLCAPALHAQQSDSILKAQLRNAMYPAHDAQPIWSQSGRLIAARSREFLFPAP